MVQLWRISRSLPIRGIRREAARSWKKSLTSVASSGGPIAEWVGERKKPDLLLVTGHLKTEEWEENGENRSKLVVVCDQVQHLQFPSQINQRGAVVSTGESQPAGQP